MTKPFKTISPNLVPVSLAALETLIRNAPDDNAELLKALLDSVPDIANLLGKKTLLDLVCKDESDEFQYVAWGRYDWIDYWINAVEHLSSKMRVEYLLRADWDVIPVKLLTAILAHAKPTKLRPAGILWADNFSSLSDANKAQILAFYPQWAFANSKDGLMQALKDGLVDVQDKFVLIEMEHRKAVQDENARHAAALAVLQTKADQARQDAGK